MDIFNQTACQLIKMLQSKEITSRQLVESVIDRIGAVDSKINAFVYVDNTAALEKADEIDARRANGEPLGALAGIPVALKDNLLYCRRPVTCASNILKGYYSSYNATVVEKLIGADAVIIGVANMDEFAMGSSCETSCYGPSRNPWNQDCITGGSSGGSAAAVAADETILALGSDTGGSIRQPSALCGVVGMKPTYGRVSRYGLVAFASSLDQIGPITKSVADNALLLQVISGYDHRDSTSINEDVPDYSASLGESIKGLKIGIPKEYFLYGMDSDIETATKKAIETFQQLGAKPVEISLPYTEYAIATYYIIATAEASANLARFDGVRYGNRAKDADNLIDMYCKTKSQGFGAEVKRRILLGTYVLSSGYYDAYYKKAQKVRTLIRDDFSKAFQKVDCIVAPTSPTSAFKIGEKIDDPLTMYLSDIFTISLNLAGLPGISIPCGFSKDSLPIGLQIIGKPFDESTILRAAYAFEQNTVFHTQKPNLV
ncbi:MAG: Asp-tRNA(Asn)/Glu-tRNA(Gln) amidotransferase subunit GatA [Candidatus Auribacterota bacterium]|jgi:aspartyl-tRNA(Asn)/glutamyl-tRNA(Gln) amidotransferase subunit A|nr:Asp-tRNA(Asn)/Glu-tRNA(Gln) amidotransferase subunit GatA [Candidatus Auribacterota bacterium]